MYQLAPVQFYSSGCEDNLQRLMAPKWFMGRMLWCKSTASNHLLVLQSGYWPH